jgi:hypothetical protein
MSRNLNAQTVLLNTVQASGADVVVGNGGELKITNTEPIEIRKVSKTSFLSTNGSNPQIHTITSTAAIAASTTYSGSITQVLEGATYTWPFTYTTPATAPAAGVFYTAINAKIQEGIDGNQIFGVVSGGSTNSVFTCTAAAPVAYVTLSNLSDAVTSTVNITTIGSSTCTNAAPRVLTSGGATGATDDKYYLITFSGVTGAGAADLNSRTLLARKISGGNTFTLYGTSATGAVVTTSATMTILNVVTNDVADYLVGCDGYNASSDYFGVEVQYETTPGLDAGLQVAQAVFVNATANSVANVDAFATAVTAALNGTSSTAVLNTLSA